MAEADAVYFMDGIDCDFWDVVERQACSEHGVEAMRNISFSKADTSKDTRFHVLVAAHPQGEGVFATEFMKMAYVFGHIREI